ncbi:MAG: hypothetical protein LQ350_000211 [Teloschistes chrysophthalmus]|nr:MAG: hypothetical protein LQ350_000211 [Niorma chrysophthalma]
MYLHTATSLLLAAVTLDTALAHTTFTNFYVDGAPQGDGTCVRMSNDIPKATWPVRPIDSQDMACGVNGNNGVARICPANSGSQLTFNFRDWPDASQPGALDKSHMGPCSVYMKKVDNSAADNNAAGPGWFKIYEEDYDNSTAQWCTSKIMANDGKLSVQIPSDLAGGYYLVRPELLALHEADKSPPDPQFYVGCAQIFLQSTGSAIPKNTVSIPGYVSMQDPAMTFHIWNAPKQLYFPQFSPPTYKSGSSKRDIETRADQLKQTFGLKPANCIMENVNWCGLTLPSYSTENGCWGASQKCSDQTTTCYSSAGPTGSKNCRNWEDYCTSVRQACGSGNFNGPPSASSFMPTAPARLSETGSDNPPSDNTPDQALGSSGDRSAMGPSTPSGGDNSVKGGSVNTCGSQGGLNSCIAYRTTILTEHTTSAASQTSSLASIILPKIDHRTPQKATYTHNQNFMHYIADAPSDHPSADPSAGGLTYLVIAPSSFGRRIPFGYLVEIKKQFLARYNPETTDFANLPPYGAGDFNVQLKGLMVSYGTTAGGKQDAISNVQKDIDNVKGIMTENIERVLERGERIDLLVDKTDRLGVGAHDFRVRSRGLKRQMWWKNVKLMVLLGVVVVFLVYLFVGFGCGLPGK